MLMIFSGLPGVGKTTLARGLSQRLGAVYLRIDSIEGALAASTLSIHPAEDAGYRAAYAVAADNLALGQSVVADSVNPVPWSREAWHAVAAQAGCPFVDIEVVCSDRAEHQRRITARHQQATGQGLPTWQDVLERDYHVWDRDGDRITVDTAHSPVEYSLAALLGDPRLAIG